MLSKTMIIQWVFSKRYFQVNQKVFKSYICILVIGFPSLLEVVGLFIVYETYLFFECIYLDNKILYDPLIYCVCAPVSGSVKNTEWLTI